MKTIKITLITAMIALGAISFGQAYKDQYINAGNSEKSSRIENLVINVLSRTDGTERNGYKEPVVYMAYTTKQADVIYEEQFDTEAWMTSPFESRYADVDLAIENWMTSPFESTFAEAELIIEDWMTSPFESTFAEAELFVEDWMTSPFYATDHIKIESWMTAAF